MDVDWAGLLSAQDVVLNSPPADTTHGLMMGNGDIATSMFGPPELLTIHVGKNDIWDYRDPMDAKTPRTHAAFLNLYADPSKPPMGPGYLTGNDDPYNQDVRMTYLGPSPTNKPAGRIRFRNSALAGAGYSARLSMWDSEAIADVTQPAVSRLKTFVSYPRNVIVVEYTPSGAQQFDIELARHTDSTGIIPNTPWFGASGRDLWVRYRFPADPATYPQGFEYVMYARVLGGSQVTSETNTNFATINQWVWEQGTRQATEGVAVAHVSSSTAVTLLVSVVTSRDDLDPLARARNEVNAAEQAGVAALAAEHQAAWHDYWQRSFVQLPSESFLTKQWFFSQYLLAASWRAGRIAPGLFGAWTWEDFPGFGNDYHWDYNMQQAIWGAYSSNHLEQTTAYDEAVHALLPTARSDAMDVYGLSGAKFFLVSYPRVYQHNPFPLIHYDKMMSLNFWVAHPLWWRYLYSQDVEYLRTRAYPVMKDCAVFYEGYLTHATDGKYDIWPTAVWDVYLSPHLAQNKNCHMDLAFIRNLMKACVSASAILNVDADKRVTWQSIADNLRDYPRATAENGEVFAPFEGTGPNDYLFPTSTMGVFPGDDIGLHSPQSLRDVAWRTAQRDTYAGAGEQLLKAMAKVRLGSNELDAYESITRATTLPNMGWIINGWANNVWIHECGAPIVINESILQSYTGQLRVAPVALGRTARFAGLRAVGAFLVSGEIRTNGQIAYITIASEVGQLCSLIRPWAGTVRVRKHGPMTPVAFEETNGVLAFPTEAGSIYIVDRPDDAWENQPIVVVSDPSARITGEVYNNSNPSQKLAGATVVLDSGASAVTGVNGQYTISGLAAGAYTVSASASGYFPGSAPNVVVADQPVTVNIGLSPAPLNNCLTDTFSRADSQDLGVTEDASHFPWFEGSEKAGDPQQQITAGKLVLPVQNTPFTYVSGPSVGGYLPEDFDMTFRISWLRHPSPPHEWQRFGLNYRGTAPNVYWAGDDWANNNGYCLFVMPDPANIWEIVLKNPAGANIGLVSKAQSGLNVDWTAQQTIRLNVLGSRHQCWVNGKLLYDVVDTANTGRGYLTFSHWVGGFAVDDVNVVATDILRFHAIDVAKSLPSGTITMLSGVVSAVYGDVAYVEAEDRSSGIRVEPASMLSGHAGSRVMVTGTIGTTGASERKITVSDVVPY